MNDIVVIDKNIEYQHGKHSNRVYVMHPGEIELTIKKVDKIARENNYTKIIIKDKKEYFAKYADYGYSMEASVPKYYKGKDTMAFYVFYYDKMRGIAKKKEKIETVLSSAKLAKSSLGINHKVYRLGLMEAEKIANLYKSVFLSYPFPIFDKEFIKKTMNDSVEYYGCYEDNELVACASSDIEIENLNCEMTDFAVLKNKRGKKYASAILEKMEHEMKKRGIKTAYTIARSVSYGMNHTFSGAEYIFSGTLKNNTQIAGEIESMNVWYKDLSI